MAGGCMVIVTVAILGVIALVGWGVSTVPIHNPMVRKLPIPADVPPAPGQPVPEIDTAMPGRTAGQLTDWADPIADGTRIPAQALRAYGNAVVIARHVWPECHLAWTTLAGIGWVETRHGSYNGNVFSPSHLDDNGYAVPKIVGIALDGSPGFAEIPDTDGGAWDGDTDYDRAVGPMQFIPTSWEIFGRDANGDGVADPHQIDDAALAAAHLLCTRGGDLATPEGWTRAVRSYNASRQYLIDVRDAAANYALGQPA
ncbi:lytic transglycosylase domain-containing protein [Corynebacterium mendelii]|uniref:Lytic murein transglycosylase n=1 Tax=Corynebacterium mendelii TaxID=2765362 RepID=A0A939IY54_9CORY|nr:lytic murein transglycosylase [Corynebacterium mendelii]MBN9644768.1 lytic murein transglycosylase [Corynebacterium mendelii]